jgi:hypothetical protein
MATLLETHGPLSIGRVLRNDNGDQVSYRLESVAQFLRSTTAAQVLDAMVDAPARRSRLAALVEDLDHIGFMASSEAEPRLGRAARAAGFDADQRAFPSTILARELSALLRRDSVETTIFKLQGKTPEGTSIAVEVSMPHEVEPAIVRDWIRRGIGAHVALRLRDRSAFGEASEVLQEEGFLIAPQMRDGPAANAAERIEVVYFGRPYPEDTVGLELCHYA